MPLLLIVFEASVSDSHMPFMQINIGSNAVKDGCCLLHEWQMRVEIAEALTPLQQQQQILKLNPSEKQEYLAVLEHPAQQTLVL